MHNGPNHRLLSRDTTALEFTLGLRREVLLCLCLFLVSFAKLVISHSSKTSGPRIASYRLCM